MMWAVPEHHELSMSRKDGSGLRHFGIAFLLAVLLYVVLYKVIEHRRLAKGPWVVTFISQTNAQPELLIRQDALKIREFRVRFTHGESLKGGSETVRFDTARAVPFEVPFGQCIFLDTSFLPGTVTLRCFDHELELLPRGIVADHKLNPWSNGSLSL